MLKADVKPDSFTFTSLMNGYYLSNEVKNAKHVFYAMTQMGVNPSTETYNSLLGGLCKTSGMSSYVWDLIDEMHNRCQADERTYIYSCLVRTYTSNSLIFALCKNGDIDKTIELVKTMIKKRIQLDICTYNILLDGMCKAGRLKNAQEAFENILIKDYQHDIYTYNIMINELCKEGLLDDTLSLLSQMEDNGCMANAGTFEIIICAPLEKD